MNPIQDTLSLDLLEDSAIPTMEIWADVLGFEVEGAWQQVFGSKIHEYFLDTITKPIRVLSLFSGVGGLDIGFHQAGFTVVEMVEIEKQFSETLTINSESGRLFEGSKPVNIDICEYDPNHLGEINFIIGGPPCQTFSSAGRRAHGVLGTDDQRGVLFREYVRLLEKLRPEGFLFENVYGIEGAQGGEPWREIVQSFSEIGYKLEYRVLDAADYGVPQHRERLIIVGTRTKTFKFPKPTHGPDSFGYFPHESASKALKGLTDVKELNNIEGIGGRYGHLLPEIPPGLNYSYYTEKMGHPSPIFAWRSKFSDFLYKADPTTPVRTIKAQGGKYTGPFHWNSRPFTVAELKRLQTIPDDFEVTGSVQRSVQQIGNSVPPQFARVLGIAVMNQVFGIPLPAPLPLLKTGEELTFRKRKREKTMAYKAAASGSKKSIIKNSYQEIVIDSNAKRFDFSEGFELSQTPKGKFAISGAVSRNRLIIKVIEVKANKQSQVGALEISPIRPWEFEFEEIRFEFQGQTDSLISVCWKALELYLSERNLKNDLVQLGGYYQYESNLRIRINFESKVSQKFVWNLLARSINEGIIGKSMKYDDVSEILEISAKELAGFMSDLRDLGFEIRNRNTNSQIPADTILIPYAFPTLNSRSVQLHKSVS